MYWKNSMKDRIIGHLNQQRPGPLMILVGGMHGNEAEGVYAIERVFEQLKEYTINEMIIVVIGNLAALEQQRLYLAYDLHRFCNDAHLSDLRSHA